MAGTRTIIAHIATFLAGIFLSNLLSTYKLSSDALMGAKLNADSAMSSLLNGDSSRAVRGGAKQINNIAGQTSDIKALEDKDREIAELQKMIADLENSNSKAYDTRTQADESAQTTPNNKHNNICSILPNPTPTALSLWSTHLPHILNATQHPEDRDFKYHDFTALLLYFMTPDRVHRGVKTLPLDWTPIERGLDVIYKRWRFIREKVEAYRAKNMLGAEEKIPSNVLQEIQNDPKIPRKLNILVMGGSVTMGVVCHINPVTATGIARRQCAWPGRMTYFFSSLFGGYELVQFHTIAMGGTNTESGITMWDYSLLPGDTPYPDVVINSYATNDMHYNSVQSALAKNITLERSVIELSQAFVRQLLTPKRACGHSPPLVLYLDDYLGNEQNEVLTTMISSQAIHLISGYYGLGSISYADAVRDIVYGDSKNWWFQANWYEKGQYQRAVHPHMGMHISNVWVVGYYLLNLLTTYCSLPENENQQSNGGGEQQSQIHHRLHAGLDRNSKGVWDYGYQTQHGMPPFRESAELKGGPKHRPRGLPPPLTDDLSLEHISQLWMDEAELHANLWKNPEECSAEGKIANDDEPIEKPCMYSWVVGLERFLDKTKTLTGKLQPLITLNEGWSAADDNNKLGWVPEGLGSKFTMAWKTVTQPVRALTLMTMRSYGEKWADSKLRVEVWSSEKLMASDEMVGFHDKNTSETYNVKIKIGSHISGEDTSSTSDNEVPIGSDLRIHFQLIGGSTFKISGMAVCDH